MPLLCWLHKRSDREQVPTTLDQHSELCDSLQPSVPPATSCHHDLLHTPLNDPFHLLKTLHNYISGDRFLHKQLIQALNSFSVMLILRVIDLSMSLPRCHHLPILLHLLRWLCLLSSSLRSLGLPMNVCLTFTFMGMLSQSNLAPPSASQFDPTRHTCRGDVS